MLPSSLKIQPEVLNRPVLVVPSLTTWEFLGKKLRQFLLLGSGKIWWWFLGLCRESYITHLLLVLLSQYLKSLKVCVFICDSRVEVNKNYLLHLLFMSQILQWGPQCTNGLSQLRYQNPLIPNKVGHLSLPVAIFISNLTWTNCLTLYLFSKFVLQTVIQNTVSKKWNPR